MNYENEYFLIGEGAYDESRMEQGPAGLKVGFMEKENGNPKIAIIPRL